MHVYQRHNLPLELILKIHRSELLPKEILKKYIKEVPSLNKSVIYEILKGRRYANITGGPARALLERRKERAYEKLYKEKPHLRPKKPIYQKSKVPPPKMWENVPPDNVTTFAHDQPFPPEPFDWENV